MYNELSFMNEDREAAEEAARLLHSELESIGIDLSDIDVPGRCPNNCSGLSRYVISLGTLAVEEVRDFTAAIRRLKQ